MTKNVHLVAIEKAIDQFAYDLKQIAREALETQPELDLGGGRMSESAPARPTTQRKNRKALIASLLQHGKKPGEIIEETGIPPATVYYYLYQFRKNGGLTAVPDPTADKAPKPKGRPRKHSPEDEKGMVEMFKSGEVPAFIAQEFGCKTRDVYAIFKRHGIVLRKTNTKIGQSYLGQNLRMKEPIAVREENGVKVTVYPPGYARGATPQRNFGGEARDTIV